MGATIFDASEGDMYQVGPAQMRLLTKAPEHAIAIIDNTVPAGFPGPVKHRHATMTDLFYVLEGTLTLDIDGEQHHLGAGGFASVPPGVVHTFSNPGEHPVRFLNIYQPSGNEQYLIEVARQTATGRSLTRAEMAEIASQYDFEPVSGES